MDEDNDDVADKDNDLDGIGVDVVCSDSEGADEVVTRLKQTIQPLSLYVMTEFNTELFVTVLLQLVNNLIK